MNNKCIDRWVPNYTEVGLTYEEASAISSECEERQENGDAREWTEILQEVAAFHVQAKKTNS